MHVRGGRRRRGPFIRTLREACPRWLLFESVCGGNGDQAVSGYTRYCACGGVYCRSMDCGSLVLWAGWLLLLCLCVRGVCAPCAGVCARVRGVSAAGRALALLLPKSLSETRVSVMAQLVSKNGVNQNRLNLERKNWRSRRRPGIERGQARPEAA